MLHGKGVGNYTENDQRILTASYEEGRKRGMYDKDLLTTAERNFYEISGNEGGGMTNYHTYEMKQFPFPTDPKIRNKRIIDIRAVDPSIGERSDI